MARDIETSIVLFYNTIIPKCQVIAGPHANYSDR